MRTARQVFLLALTVITFLLLTRMTPAQGPASPADTAAAVMERVLVAHGRQWATGEIADSVGDGKLTFFGIDGPKAAFDLTLWRKGDTRVQRVIKQPAGELRQGTNGLSSWESIAGFHTLAAQGRALQFLESQTTRSVQRLFNYQKEGLMLRDLGTEDNERVIEAEDRRQNKTTYFIDPDKNVITKLEFVTGELRDPFSGAVVPDTDTYVFSDYRVIQGILTPFRIERYSAHNKIEEMQFSTVRYNAGLNDADFRR